MKKIKGTFRDYTNTMKSGSLCLEVSRHLDPFQTSGTNRPTTRHHIPGDSRLQQHCHQNITSHTDTCISAMVQCLNCNMMQNFVTLHKAGHILDQCGPKLNACPQSSVQTSNTEFHHIPFYNSGLTD